MEPHRQRRLTAQARVLKAIAHPSRLCILEELSRQERSVGELARMVGADLSTVSKHLTLLRQTGIVEDHKRGTQVYYKLRVPCVLNFLSCIEAVLTHQAAEQQALVTPPGAE